MNIQSAFDKLNSENRNKVKSFMLDLVWEQMLQEAAQEQNTTAEALTELLSKAE